MARIGSFTAEKDGYVGSIRSLSINIKARFVANKDKASDGAPDFRIYGGSAELGAAWWARSNSAAPPRDYLSVRLDDPALPAPIRAALILEEETATLIWNRRSD